MSLYLQRFCALLMLLAAIIVALIVDPLLKPQVYDITVPVMAASKVKTLKSIGKNVLLLGGGGSDLKISCFHMT